MSLKSLIANVLRIGTVFPTAFPGLPFFRTDLGILCWYSSAASAWLGPEMSMPMTRRAGAHQPFTSNDWIEHVPWKSTRTLWVTSWVMDCYVAGTNDASNFWSIDLLRVDNDTAIATIVTSTHGGNAWNAQDATSFTGNPMPTTVKAIEVELIKTGSPGGIYPEVFLRAKEVVT